jgi:hypothetical protein
MEWNLSVSNGAMSRDAFTDMRTAQNRGGSDEAEPILPNPGLVLGLDARRAAGKTLPVQDVSLFPWPN